MEVIAKYKAFDGTEFLEEHECRSHESIVLQIEEAISELANRPTSIEFENGGGFIQHDKGTALRVRANLLEIAEKHFTQKGSRSDAKWIRLFTRNEYANPSRASYAIGLTKIQALINAWYRFECMTDDFREFGQPHYREHPEAAQNFNVYDSVK